MSSSNLILYRKRFLYVGSNNGKGHIKGMIFFNLDPYESKLSWNDLKWRLIQKTYTQQDIETEMNHKVINQEQLIKQTYVYLSPHGINIDQIIQDEMIHSNFHDDIDDKKKITYLYEMLCMLFNNKDILWVDLYGQKYQYVYANLSGYETTPRSIMSEETESNEDVLSIDTSNNIPSHSNELNSSSLLEVVHTSKDDDKELNEKDKKEEAELQNQHPIEISEKEKILDNLKQSFQVELDHLCYGFTLLKPCDYDNNLTKIPNVFQDYHGILQRQFHVYIDPWNAQNVFEPPLSARDRPMKGICSICPSTLKNVPTNNFSLLLEHVSSKWHKRYLSFALHGDVFLVSLSLRNIYEKEYHLTNEMDQSLERMNIYQNNQRHQLMFGYQISQAKHRIIETQRLRKNAIIIQCAMRQFIAQTRFKKRKEKLMQEKNLLYEKKKAQKDFIWCSLIKDLCKHCTEFKTCLIHKKLLAILEPDTTQPTNEE